MKCLAIVKEIRDAGYENKKTGGHVDAKGILLTEIGADSFGPTIEVQVPPEKAKFAIGDQVDFVLTNFRNVFKNVVQCDGVVTLHKR